MRTQEEILQGEQLHTFLMKCSMDFKLWCNRVIQDPTDHSKGLSIQPFHMEWFNSVHTKPRSCIRAPREHGKTLLLGAAYPLWVVFFNQFKEILIVSNTLEQSTKVLEVIKETIRQNKLLDKLIPVDKDATWSKTEIHTSTRCKIFCKPNNDNIRGSHVNYVICVPGNTSIETINGSKKISEIKIGDYVKTYRDRFKQVLKVMKRDSSEKILEIIAGENKLKITKNHPILVRRNKILKWVPAGKIQMSDRLCYPLRGKIKSLRIPRRGVKKLSDYIMVNEDVGRLFGLFAAEGSLGKSMIRLTFNSKEINFIEETQRLIENNFKVKTNLDKHNSWATTVYSCSVALKKLFLNNFGSNSKERKVPNIILNSPNSVKACFVKGWLDGDGTHGKGSILGSTISKELCEGIGKLSNDLGFLPKLTFVKNAKSKNKIYNLYFDANSVRKLNTLASIKKHRRFFYIPIKQISWVRNCSRLYNIEVLDDNSYIANGIVVHNCDEPATYREKDVFWRVITPTVQIKKGNICVIGTPESEYDLLADIMKNPAYDSKTYKAEYMEKGVKKVLWPEKFTIDRLEKLKEEIGIDAYKKEYLCDPIPDKTQVFQSKWIHEATNYDIGFSQPEDGGLYYIGADFAMSRGKKADYSVFCLVERTKDNKIIIRHMERYKGLPHKTQEQKIIGMWKKWSAKRVNLDESTFGRIITDNLRLDGLPVIGTTFSPVERHQLLAYLQNQFEKNRIVIPRKPGGLTTHLTSVLMEELSKFGYFTNRRTGTTSFKSFGAHDDTVIALALAVKVAGESKRILTHVATPYSVSKKAFKNKGGIIHIDTRIRDN